MTTITNPKKPVAVNPLKQSPPLGAALAFLGLKGMVPLFHGSQGCTAFAKVILVRHFREAIPVATTAMSEVSTILGGEDNIEQAILTLVENAKPDLLGLFTTGLTETRGDDMPHILKSIRQSHPELDNLPIILVSTPDYKGALQEGYAAAVQAIVSQDYGTPTETSQDQVTILAGSFLSPGDVAEIKEIVEAFGLKPLVIPDLSESMDGHLEDDHYYAKTPGGTSLEELKQLARSRFTIAIGESMRSSAEILKQKFGTNYTVFSRLNGLNEVDQFIWLLAQMATAEERENGTFQPKIPRKYQRQRRQLQDAILDSHFFFGGQKVALALEPDLLYQTSCLLSEMGAKINAAVTTTESPILEQLPTDRVTVGDLEDLEDLATDSDLMITNSQGKRVADKLKIPLYRLGYPIFDRLGNGSRCCVGYRGTMQTLFEIGNLFIDNIH
ncbi:nitrogenase molybdenum-iron cofactor biosynthesis protein NifN [Halothece sp. PCC 7418]|uniref:nitrogenase iron-molybdenum cofactor biosynthesis protein NifN n=1 Tax=Halothece sp. (strain PCC 7418) TaxID=65093 RepID=UPI0002A08A98|nr:nitrogenase iron-molybdenum cofactor biosynthesis protein NifN [Halothece sp. PCC 7418]AFZ43959.1 nitrogenase molybdenum-iron cofactor biosynthesis protein NifN [Halothece sp. PCC 7418]